MYCRTEHLHYILPAPSGHCTLEGFVSGNAEREAANKHRSHLKVNVNCLVPAIHPKSSDQSYSCRDRCGGKMCDERPVKYLDVRSVEQYGPYKEY